MKTPRFTGLSRGPHTRGQRYQHPIVPTDAPVGFVSLPVVCGSCALQIAFRQFLLTNRPHGVEREGYASFQREFTQWLPTYDTLSPRLSWQPKQRGEFTNLMNCTMIGGWVFLRKRKTDPEHPFRMVSPWNAPGEPRSLYNTCCQQAS